MTRRTRTVKQLVIGTVALGTVALGTVGLAGADTPSPAAKTAHHHYNCANAPKALARIQATESKIAAGLPQLHAALNKAQEKGKTTRADRIRKRINRLESPAFKARLEKRKAKIMAVCQVKAPAVSSTGASTTA